MNNNTTQPIGRWLRSPGSSTSVALLGALLMAEACSGQPEIGWATPPDGALFVAGDTVSLRATVANNGVLVTGVDFLANGLLLGHGQPDPHGEWDYADGSHLSVMNGFFGESMDYSTPGMGEFFTMEGSFATPSVFVGQFTTWAGGAPVSGGVTVTLGFTGAGDLNATIDGQAPLGQRALTAGTRGTSESPYTLAWPDVAAGNYTLRAVARYGASQTVTSAPIAIKVVAGTPHGSDYTKILTATGDHGPEWQDTQQQLGVSHHGIVVGWHALTTGTNDVNTNRIYCARSMDNGATFQPWVLVKEQADATFYFSPQWLAVDGMNVHVITLSKAAADGGQRLEYYRSTDAGATFEPSQLLGSTGPGEAISRALIAASDGKVSIAVSSAKLEHPNALKFLRSSDAGATWQGEEIYLTSSASIDLAELHQSGDNITLTWDAGSAGGFWFDGRAQVACSSDSGATFTATILEDPLVEFAGGNHSDTPRLARDGATVLTLFVRENISGSPTFAELFLRRSTDGGLTFGAPVNLALGLSDIAGEVPADGQFDVALDGANVCVVFGTTDNQLYLTRSEDGGASFAAPVLLADRYFNIDNPAGGGFTNPRLVQDPYQPAKLHLFWGGAWYSASADTGASWTAPVNLMLQYSGWAIHATQIAADFMGGFHSCQYGFWQRFGAQDYDVVYRRFDRDAVPAATLNLAAQFAQNPANYLRFDNLQIPGVPALDLTNGLSIECWVKLGGDTNVLNADIVSREAVGIVPFPTFRLSVTGGALNQRWFQAEVSDGSLDSPLAQNVEQLIPVGAWNHVAMTFDASLPTDNLKLYVNGELQGASTSTKPLLPSPRPIIISRFLDGAVDDLRFWNRSLAAEEIRDRFTGPLTGNESGLAAYYTFDGTWADSTGNGLPAVPMYRESFGPGADVDPRLTIAPLPGGELRLSWVNFGTDFAPASASELSSSDWQPVPGTPQKANGLWTLTTPMSGTRQFFRLRRP